jgi:hypothetical protein
MLEAWRADGAISEADASRVAEQVSAANARRVYELEPTTST